MKYVKEDGTNKHLIIALHGTGGSASDLFGLAKALDPEASLVGFEGNVNENGMRRFFARFPNGTFDLESLKAGSDDLYRSIKEVIMRYNFGDHTLSVLGYSNGANIAKDLLKEYQMPEISNVLLFHPSPITPEKAFKDQDGLNLFMTSGKQDPYITATQFKEMEDKMTKAEINVSAFTHEQGHQLVQAELYAAKEFLQGKI